MPKELTEQQKNQLTLRLTEILEGWKLTDQDQITLLGVSFKT